MAIVPDITVKLRLDTKGFKRSLRRASRQLRWWRLRSRLCLRRHSLTSGQSLRIMRRAGPRSMKELGYLTSGEAEYDEAGCDQSRRDSPGDLVPGDRGPVRAGGPIDPSTLYLVGEAGCTLWFPWPNAQTP